MCTSPKLSRHLTTVGGGDPVILPKVIPVFGAVLNSRSHLLALSLLGLEVATWQ
jgi:hypothetical protein